MMTNYTTWTQRLIRDLAALGLLGAIASMTQGINGIIGAVLILAMIEGIISLGVWIKNRLPGLHRD